MAQCFRGVEVFVMGDFLAGVPPYFFGCVVFRRIRWEQIYLDSFSIFGKPGIDFGLLMVGSVILNEIDAMAWFVEGGQQYFVQERDISVGVEVLGLMAVGELTGGGTDRAKYFLTVALSFGWDAGLRIAHGPGLVQSGSLTEGGFVFVND